MVLRYRLICFLGDDYHSKGALQNASAEDIQHKLYVFNGLEYSKHHENKVKTHTTPKPSNIFLPSRATTRTKMQDLKTYVGVDPALQVGERFAVVAWDNVDISCQLGELDETVNKMGCCGRRTD